MGTQPFSSPLPYQLGRFKPPRVFRLRLECTKPMLETDCAEAPRTLESALSTGSDQAVALRRPGICDPLVARDDSVEFARGRVRYCGRLRRTSGPWAGHR